MNRRRCTAVLTAFCFAALAAGSGLAQPIDIGPAVGSAIPALSVRDETGAVRGLADVAGPRGAVLVFFRSARWCPYCQKQLIALQAVAPRLSAAGYPIVAISYDPPPALAQFRQKQGLSYALYADEGSRMIDAFKIRDPQYPKDSFAYGVPRPSIFIVDRAGVVRAKLAEDGYKVRPEGEAVLAAVDKLAR